MARVVCIGDTHGQHAGLRVPDGDILIHAGDFMTYGDAPREIIDFNTWLARQPHAHKTVIAGNHDRLFRSHPMPARALITNAIYLEDSGVEVARKMRAQTAPHDLKGGWTGWDLQPVGDRTNPPP